METKTSSARTLFTLGWAANFCTYVGRRTYSACMGELIALGVLSKSAAGLVATAFFICYGLGQIVNAFFGDSFPPLKTLLTGLIGSGLLNLLMPLFSAPALLAALWGLNGFLQSLILPPIVRLLSAYLSKDALNRASVNLRSSGPMGTLFCYVAAALFVYLFSAGKPAFWLAGAALLSVALSYLILGKKYDFSTAERSLPKPEKGKNARVFSLISLAGGAFLLLALLIEGALNDGITGWIPTLLFEEYDLSVSLSILSTAAAPLFSVGGVLLAKFFSRRKNEMRSMGVMFFLSFLLLLLLFFLRRISPLFALLFLCLTSSFMNGIDVLIVSVVPNYFKDEGRIAGVFGLLNFFVYAGSALSMYAFGQVSALFGWDAAILLWVGLALIGAVLALLAGRAWGKYKENLRAKEKEAALKAQEG